jgi:hypothetical protein
MARNQIQLYCDRKNEYIFEYQIFADSPLADYFQSLSEHFKELGNVCLLDGDTMYLKKRLCKKVTEFKVASNYSKTILVSVKFRRQVKIKFSSRFFQTLLFTKIIDHLNDIGGKCGQSYLLIQLSCDLSLAFSFRSVRGFRFKSLAVVQHVTDARSLARKRQCYCR